ncbi:ADP-ribosylation factor-like protein 9 [Cebidichthys violaceus]|uniref:ADP-ribosylation factor-like protein 9 n=1 Tax=Cebidichthys violaceus TaxID=271503 RepID=UPI0035CAB3F7
MFGLREAGVLGASVALAGGVAYFIWNFSSGEKKPQTRPRKEGKRAGEAEEEDRGGEAPDDVFAAAEPTIAAAATPVVAAEPKKTSESKPVESTGTQVLVLGLDGSGKTSLLNCLSTGCLEQDTQPTLGFNAVSIHREDLHIEFLELGGKEELRPYWQKYMSRALMLVFVVDSSTPKLFPLAKKHLHEVLASEPRLPLMVLANKQDLAGSCGVTELHDALSLSEVGERRLFLIGTYVKKGEKELGSGVQDARDLITQMVCEGR